MNIIQPDDKKGFERERRPTREALKTGAAFGVAIFGILLSIAGANPPMLRYMALYPVESRGSPRVARASPLCGI
jgi:hypothetical protein